MFNIVDNVFDLLQDGKCFSTDDIAEFFFDDHGYFDLVKRVQSVVDQVAFQGQIALVRRSEVVFQHLHHITFHIFSLF